MMGYLFGAMLAMGSGHKMPDVYEIKEQIRRQKPRRSCERRSGLGG